MKVLRRASILAGCVGIRSSLLNRQLETDHKMLLRKTMSSRDGSATNTVDFPCLTRSLRRDQRATVHIHELLRFRCSARGSSSPSQLARDSSQIKHTVLSGVSSSGSKKKPASARDSGLSLEVERWGHVALMVFAFFEREEEIVILRSRKEASRLQRSRYSFFMAGQRGTFLLCFRVLR